MTQQFYKLPKSMLALYDPSEVIFVTDPICRVKLDLGLNWIKLKQANLLVSK